MRRCRGLVAVLLSAALLVGCGGGTDKATSGGAEPSSTEVWDLTWFSDSSVRGVQQLWIDRMERTFGVQVRVHDYSGMGSDSSAFNVLNKLQDDPEVRASVAGSEVILVEANPMGAGLPKDLGDSCYFDFQKKPPAPVTRSDYRRYAHQLRAVYDKIFELRGDEPTIIRATDVYVPVVAEWREAGKFAACMRSWELGAAVEHQVAREYGVPMLSLLDLFNGPRHDRDMAAAGLLEDPWHLNVRAERIAERALDALGYDPVTS